MSLPTFDGVWLEIHDSERDAVADGCECRLVRTTPSVVAFVPCEEHAAMLGQELVRVLHDEEE